MVGGLVMVCCALSPSLCSLLAYFLELRVDVEMTRYADQGAPD